MKYVFLYLNASTIYILERSVFIIIKSLLYFGLVEVKYFSEQGFNLAGIHLHEQLKISVVGFIINRRRSVSSQIRQIKKQQKYLIWKRYKNYEQKAILARQNLERQKLYSVFIVFFCIIYTLLQSLYTIVDARICVFFS